MRSAAGRSFGWFRRPICPCPNGSRPVCAYPADVSANPREVRLSPYQRQIADAIGDPALERVTLVKSVRVGFTTLLTGALGCFVANEPAPILALLPTEAECRD